MPRKGMDCEKWCTVFKDVKKSKGKHHTKLAMKNVSSLPYLTPAQIKGTFSAAKKQRAKLVLDELTGMPIGVKAHKGAKKVIPLVSLVN